MSKGIIEIRMKYGLAGYAVYYMLLERIADSPSMSIECLYGAYAFDFGAEEPMVKDIAENYGLFTIADGYLRAVLFDGMFLNTREHNANKTNNAPQLPLFEDKIPYSPLDGQETDEEGESPRNEHGRQEKLTAEELSAATAFSGRDVLAGRGDGGKSKPDGDDSLTEDWEKYFMELFSGAKGDFRLSGN